MWRFESVHGFTSVGNLYQKMHFAGSNPATGQKTPKCIYKISKNFRVEKSGEISRNLRFSRFFVPASKSDTHHGWDSWTRTSEMQESKSCALPTWRYPNIQNSGIIAYFRGSVNSVSRFLPAVPIKIGNFPLFRLFLRAAEIEKYTSDILRFSGNAKT